MASRVRITFLILLIGFSVVNCGKRTAKRQIFQAGIGYCNGPQLGDFDVLLSRSVDNAGFYDLKVVTISVFKLGGEYVRVAIANKELDFEELVPAMLLKKGQVLFEGQVSEDQLNLYDLLVVAPYKGGQSDFLNTKSDGTEAICALPTRDTTT